MPTETDWHSGLAKLHQRPPPADYSGINLPRWKALLSDGERFLDRWGQQAAALGWTTIDLFGCSRVKPHARIDLAGLVPLLNGQRVVEMTETAAVIEDHGQGHSRFMRRRPLPEQVALWQLAR